MDWDTQQPNSLNFGIQQPSNQSAIQPNNPYPLPRLCLHELPFDTVIECPACKIPLGRMPQRQGARASQLMAHFKGDGHRKQMLRVLKAVKEQAECPVLTTASDWFNLCSGEQGWRQQIIGSSEAVDKRSTPNSSGAGTGPSLGLRVFSSERQFANLPRSRSPRRHHNEKYEDRKNYQVIEERERETERQR